MAFYDAPHGDFHMQREPPGRVIYDGKRMRKAITRRTVDYNATLVAHLEHRVTQKFERDVPVVQPWASYIRAVMPPSAYEENPTTSMCTKFVHTSINKIRCPINVAAWTPEGRRLITGASSGEFTLWNGLTFNFETILQAHDTAVRAMVWSHNENWMVTGDHGGTIKYWQSNMNNAKAFPAHNEAVRDVSFCPTDLKFATCSDDVSIKIWDFARCEAERTMQGHGGDVKCISWHPFRSLLVSGSKDSFVKVWDARNGKNITTLHGHKSTVMSARCNKNGNWLLTASRDQLIKIFDLRMMKEMQTFRGHKREVTTISWHPSHEDFFCSGSFDGSILFWIVGSPEPAGEIIGAHDSSVWDLAWHPLGHLLCSGSNDHTTKFWCRNRPGDTMKDKYNVRGGAEIAEDIAPSYGGGAVSIPGLGASIPGLGGGSGPEVTLPMRQHLPPAPAPSAPSMHGALPPHNMPPHFAGAAGGGGPGGVGGGHYGHHGGGGRNKRDRSPSERRGGGRGGHHGRSHAGGDNNNPPPPSFQHGVPMPYHPGAGRGAGPPPPAAFNAPAAAAAPPLMYPPNAAPPTWQPPMTAMGRGFPPVMYGVPPPPAAAYAKGFTGQPPPVAGQPYMDPRRY